ncbi:MAG: PD-(D/E)XK nuclease family protein, partial [Stackebrandtia sp.]
MNAGAPARAAVPAVEPVVGAVGDRPDSLDDPAAGPTLSPSRASDFMTCPLLYRFRTIDRLPEPPSHAATRGTVVHAVL